MTLDEYISEQHTKLESFKQWWKEEFAAETLDPGDWDEQFKIYNDGLRCIKEAIEL